MDETSRPFFVYLRLLKINKAINPIKQKIDSK